MPYSTELSSFTATDTAIPMIAVDDVNLISQQFSSTEQCWLSANGFNAEENQFCVLANDTGNIDRVVVGLPDVSDSQVFARLASELPPAVYDLPVTLDKVQQKAAAITWALAQYRFTAYKADKKNLARLTLAPELMSEVVAIVEAIYLVRDLINTPTQDMGPAELSQAMQALSVSYAAHFSEVVGEDLLTENFPAIHAVGRASDSAPRLLEMHWGDDTDPKLTLVGKGVCFDSGGLDVKPSSGMRFMKKDMGGAAHVLGLAKLIMQLGLKVRLQVLIPAVENAISGNAYRPGDILETRKGLSVEVGNTDAEGRLVLADALSLACETPPALLIDFATLTGAARIAVGTDIAAMFSNDDDWAASVEQSSAEHKDPVWRMPLHQAYLSMIQPKHADLSNSGTSSYGGAITAALFLEQFIDKKCPWLHFDVMAWNTSSRPGKPEGGEALGLRAVFAALKQHFGDKDE